MKAQPLLHQRARESLDSLALLVYDIAMDWTKEQLVDTGNIVFVHKPGSQEDPALTFPAPGFTRSVIRGQHECWHRWGSHPPVPTEILEREKGRRK